MTLPAAVTKAGRAERVHLLNLIRAQAAPLNHADPAPVPAAGSGFGDLLAELDAVEAGMPASGVSMTVGDFPIVDMPQPQSGQNPQRPPSQSPHGAQASASASSPEPGGPAGSDGGSALVFAAPPFAESDRHGVRGLSAEPPLQQLQSAPSGAPAAFRAAPDAARLMPRPSGNPPSPAGGAPAVPVSRGPGTPPPPAPDGVTALASGPASVAAAHGRADARPVSGSPPADRAPPGGASLTVVLRSATPSQVPVRAASESPPPGRLAASTAMPTRQPLAMPALGGVRPFWVSSPALSNPPAGSVHAPFPVPVTPEPAGLRSPPAASLARPSPAPSAVQPALGSPVRPSRLIAAAGQDPVLPRGARLLPERPTLPAAVELQLPLPAGLRRLRNPPGEPAASPAQAAPVRQAVPAALRGTALSPAQSMPLRGKPPMDPQPAAPDPALQIRDDPPRAGVQEPEAGGIARPGAGGSGLVPGAARDSSSLAQTMGLRLQGEAAGLATPRVSPLEPEAVARVVSDRRSQWAPSVAPVAPVAVPQGPLAAVPDPGDAGPRMPALAEGGNDLPTVLAAPPHVLAAEPRSAPSLSVATRVVQPQVGSPAWPGAVAELLTQNLSLDGVVKARLQLTPHELGNLTVDITQDGDQVDLRVVTESAAARAAFEEALPRLRGMFADQGLQLGGTNVQQGEAEQRQPGGRERGQAGGSGDETAAEAPAFRSAQERQGLVDDYA